MLVSVFFKVYTHPVLFAGCVFFSGGVPMDSFKSKARKKLFQLVLKLLAPLALPLAVIVIIMLLAMSVYSVMIPAGYMTGVQASEEDQKLKERYRQLEAKWNAADCWLVSSEPYGRSRLYPSRGGQRLDRMSDKYGQDQELRLKWGTIHSVGLFYALQKGLDKVPDKLPDEIAEKLHPYFYYIERTESVSGPEGTSSWPVKLLVEARTVYGWYQYHYEQVTKKHGDATVVTWELKDTVQLDPDPYQCVKSYLKNLYQTDGDIDTEAVWVVEAGEGFTAGKEWAEFLAREYSPSVYVSVIPPQYRAFLDEAEQKYGVPSWFLAALIQRESSWDVRAVNSKTGCFGLTQQHPDFYAERWRKLGFDPVKDKFNPRAQILAGAYTLMEYAGTVNWSDWENDPNLKSALSRYGGYERIEKAGEYIAKIFDTARAYRTARITWPVDSVKITEYFGKTSLVHPEPHTGIDIAVPEGTTVYSASAGVVYQTGYSDTFGNYVLVRDNKYEYLYAHLSSVLASKNRTVNPGMPVGYSGNTGRSTGPHLHFSVRDYVQGYYIDPLLLLPRA